MNPSLASTATLRSVRDEAQEIVDDPDAWLDTPNESLGGRRPNDLVNTKEEAILRNLIEQLKHGMPT